MSASDVASTSVPLWGVFTHLLVFVGGWYAHMKLGQQAQAVVNEVKADVEKV